jgi:hypothetical protein
MPGSPIQPMGDLMRPRRRAVTGLAIAAAALAPAIGTAGSAAAAAYTPLPAHVYAPYYETYLVPNTPGITATAQASGAKYFTLAFLQSAGKHSCALDWNGNSAQPLGYYASDIASLRAMGGDVIPSFGGYSADHGGTEIADSCTSVSQIAADYEQVITTLGVTRLDMDVESRSLNNTAGIDRRNRAIALTEQWAEAQNPPIPLQIQYTIPVEQYGLDANGESVLQSAVANGATVTSVNIMVFDYYIAGEGVVNMGQAAENAATNTHTQLQSIFPNLTAAQIWAAEGMTLLPGIDDYPKKTEVTYLADAQTMLNFAQANNMNFLSIWAIQRDNGGCPAPPTATPVPASRRAIGTSATCSGRSPGDVARPLADDVLERRRALAGQDPDGRAADGFGTRTGQGAQGPFGVQGIGQRNVEGINIRVIDQVLVPADRSFDAVVPGVSLGPARIPASHGRGHPAGLPEPGQELCPGDVGRAQDPPPGAGPLRTHLASSVTVVPGSAGVSSGRLTHRRS